MAAQRSRTDAVHGSWLKVHENRAGHVAATSGLIAVHVGALQLQVRVTVVRARGVDAVLVRDGDVHQSAHLTLELVPLRAL